MEDDLKVFDEYVKDVTYENYESNYKQYHLRRWCAYDIMQTIRAECLECCTLVEIPLKLCYLSKTCPKRIHLGGIETYDYNYEYRTYVYQVYYYKQDGTWGIHQQPISIHNLIVIARQKLPFFIGKIQDTYSIEIDHMFYSHLDSDVFAVSKTFHSTRKHFEPIRTTSHLLDEHLYKVVRNYDCLRSLISQKKDKNKNIIFNGITIDVDDTPITSRTLTARLITINSKTFLYDYLRKLCKKNDVRNILMKSSQMLSNLIDEIKITNGLILQFKEQKYELCQTQEIIDEKQKYLIEENNCLIPVKDDISYLEPLINKFKNGVLKCPTAPKKENRAVLPVIGRKNAIQNISDVVI